MLIFKEFYTQIDRSFIYNIAPIGVGTPFVESLSGYLSRIASLHLIRSGDLIGKIITPMLNKRYLNNQVFKGGDGLYKSSNGINGIGILAQEITNILGELTFRTDIKSTTLLNWSDVLSTRGLLKKQRAWCPECYMEDYSNQGVTYERLIWNFKVINFCTKHNCYLSFKCLFCDRVNPVLTRKSRPGYCSICEKWLGVIPNNSNLSSVHENDIFAKIIEELVSQNNIHRAEKDNVHMNNAIIHYINECFEGEGSRMAKELNIPLSTLITWRSGKSLPEIKSLIKICAFLGVSISEFLNNKKADCEYMLIKNPVIRINDKKERKRHNHQEIKGYLDFVIKNNLPLSRSKIAANLGCDRKLLSQRYPNECNKIKDNYNKYLEDMKKKRDIEKFKKVEEAFYLITRKGEYPSRREMEKILGEGVLREKILQQRWKSLKEKERIELC